MEDSPRTWPPEVLLARDDMVRRLARALVRDPDAADDAAQEAWARALAARPGPLRDAAAWLKTIVRNVTRTGAVADAQRRARERAAAREEADVAADHVMVFEERRRSVVDAVLGLPEPYRQAVLLRFWEGLSPREIAERQGETAVAVRSRLSRAMAMLRARLDVEHGGSRAAWLVPLAVWTRRGARAGASVAGAAGTTWLVGWFGGTVRALVVAAIVVALGGATVWMVTRAGDETAPPAIVPRVAEVPRAAAGPPPERRESAGPPAAETPKVELPRVVNQDGKGVPGLAWWWADLPLDSRELDVPERTWITEADGRVRIDLHPADGATMLWVRFTDGLLGALATERAEKGKVIHRPELAWLALIVSGIPRGDPWSATLRPTILDSPGFDGPWGISASLDGATALAIRARTVDSSDAAADTQPTRSGRSWAPLKVLLPRYVEHLLSIRTPTVTLPEHGRVMTAPDEVRISLPRHLPRSLAATVRVLEPNGSPARSVGGTWIAQPDGQERGGPATMGPVIDGVGELWCVDPPKNPRTGKVRVLLDDGEVFETEVEWSGTRSDPVLELARGTGRSPTLQLHGAVPPSEDGVKLHMRSAAGELVVPHDVSAPAQPTSLADDGALWWRTSDGIAILTADDAAPTSLVVTSRDGSVILRDLDRLVPLRAGEPVALSAHGVARGGKKPRRIAFELLLPEIAGGDGWLRVDALAVWEYWKVRAGRLPDAAWRKTPPVGVAHRFVQLAEGFPPIEIR